MSEYKLVKVMTKVGCAGLVLGFCVGLFLCGCSSSSGDSSPPVEKLKVASLEALGEALYFDTRLSLNGTQSCATCHDPDAAFVDPRLSASGGVLATSLGDDGTSFGDRNTPTAAYAALTPEFGVGAHPRFNSKQPDYAGFVGGQFLDGREPTLANQAGQPLLNPLEMAMPDKASVIARVKDDADYVAAFEALFGKTIWDSTDAAYTALSEAIAAFESTEQFLPFSSKYDKFIRGEYRYDPLSKAGAGKSLFFSQQFTNCATCHQLKPNGSARETFTSYEYHNIGVPTNIADRVMHGLDPDFKDEGLAANPAVTAQGMQGKFKVPTLRNVAVTGPYMHNGVFKDLKTVIEFYDHFLAASDHTLNPETGEPWAAPVFPNTISQDELEEGRKLTEDEVVALVCFLHTLTDARYEHLIDDDLHCNDQAL